MIKENERSEAQKRADAVYFERNKERRRKATAKAQTKKYINVLADIDELTEVQNWIEKRMLELKG